jgi:Zn-dependent protease with chaperone function
MPEPASPRIPARYFDGHSGAVHEVLLWCEGEMLQIAGKTLMRQAPLRQVQWPERTRHGPRLAHLPGGGSVQALESAQWDDWVAQTGLGESLVVRAQQSWRWALLATALLLAITLSAYRWGLPLASQAVTALIPGQVERQIGDTALSAMEGRLLGPSGLDPAQQAAIREGYARARGLRFPRGNAPGVSLQFRRSHLGPNAFALPGGTIVVTDELVQLLADRPDILLGVLGHETGHVHLRHGTRSLVQASVLGTVAALALGDVSTLLSTTPVLLGQMAYSRDFEREADNEAIAWLRASQIRPSVMATLFERLHATAGAQAHQGPTGPHADRDGTSAPLAQTLGIAFRSHPADAERIQRFQAADQPTVGFLPSSPAPSAPHP